MPPVFLAFPTTPPQFGPRFTPSQQHDRRADLAGNGRTLEGLFDPAITRMGRMPLPGRPTHAPFHSTFVNPLIQTALTYFHLKPDCTLAKAKKAYRQALRRSHPDITGNPVSADDLNQVVFLWNALKRHYGWK